MFSHGLHTTIHMSFPHIYPLPQATPPTGRGGPAPHQEAVHSGNVAAPNHLSREAAPPCSMFGTADQLCSQAQHAGPAVRT